MKAKLSGLLADVLFPQYNACHLCGRFTEQADVLCQSCHRALQMLRLRGLKIASPELHSPLAVCLAAYPHANEAREMVHLLKYQSDCFIAQPLGEAMAAAFALSPLRPQTIDAVIPVPLHASRLEQRGYNQAQLLAQAVCFHLQLPLLQDTLVRLRPTDTQTHLDRAKRLKAMEHAFAVDNPEAVCEKHLLLVDDVLTTGATAMSCAIALKDAGAASVSLLTVCRA